MMKNKDTISFPCDFHREQAWERWLSKPKHEMTGKKYCKEEEDDENDLTKRDVALHCLGR